jgi:hypothetical protein
MPLHVAVELLEALATLLYYNLCLGRTYHMFDIHRVLDTSGAYTRVPQLAPVELKRKPSRQSECGRRLGHAEVGR